MKIQESSLQMQATHEASRVQRIEIQRDTQFRQIFSSMATQQDSEAAESGRKRVQDLLQSLVEAILAALDGKKCAQDVTDTANACTQGSGAGQTTKPSGGLIGELSWSETRYEYLKESESSTVCGQGSVTCADGRSLEFDFSFKRAREFEQTSVGSRSGKTELRDPLMLTFAGESSELTGQRMAFDLDADGQVEEIPGLGEGAGFLVFDRNGNGRADDGSELFGTRSGNGFADLAKLDDDHNGWIDEGDRVFAQLGLWTANGMRSLNEMQVGAIATSTVDAPFALKTEGNELLGQIRAAGVYLTEAGRAGQVMQVDLALNKPQETATNEPSPAATPSALATAAGHEPEQGQHLAA